MLEVQIGNIIPVTEARDSFNQLVDKVEGSDEMFVLTKNGKPSAILVGVHHLEKLTGQSQEDLMGDLTNNDDSQVQVPVSTDSGADLAAAASAPVADAITTPLETAPANADQTVPAPAEPISPVQTPVEPATTPAATPEVDSDDLFGGPADASGAVPAAPSTDPIVPTGDPFAMPANNADANVGSTPAPADSNQDGNPTPPTGSAL